MCVCVCDLSDVCGRGGTQRFRCDGLSRHQNTRITLCAVIQLEITHRMANDERFTMKPIGERLIGVQNSFHERY